MHNNIMATGSKERPPMLGPGRYSQWRSRFLRYIDTKANGEYLRKCIFDGPYKLYCVLCLGSCKTSYRSPTGFLRQKDLRPLTHRLRRFQPKAMVLVVEWNRREHLIRRFAGRGNEPDPRERIQELEFPQLQQDSPTEEAETESNVWDDGLEDVNPFGEGNSGFQEEPIVLVEEESCPVYDTDNEEEESMSVYDTDIEDFIKEEE
ncbi:hypothetical protein Tco_1235907 [Tanacetum coccineum]